MKERLGDMGGNHEVIRADESGWRQFRAVLQKYCFTNFEGGKGMG